jgi:hypothetical protein
MTASLEEHLKRTTSKIMNCPDKGQTEPLPSVADTATTVDMELDGSTSASASNSIADEETVSEISLAQGSAKEWIPSVTESASPHDLSYRSMCASSVRSEAVGVGRRRLSVASAASTGSKSRAQAHVLRSPGGWKKMKAPKSTSTSASTSEDALNRSWHSCSASVMSTGSRAASTSTPPRPRNAASPKAQALQLAAMMQGQAEENNPEQPRPQPQPASTSPLDFWAETIAQSTFMKNMDYLFGSH